MPIGTKKGGVLVVGSDVAAGEANYWTNTGRIGWVKMLADSLLSTYQLRLTNLAKRGVSVTKAKKQLEQGLVRPARTRAAITHEPNTRVAAA